ncbi:hypothetical protein B0T18DRAFT_202804 [Schizothecium vesticola]|uniref:Uncharacterized protein n=1 Tax=Schizothecium vesticola TaxID=314040 RepID=A0AA40BTP4_9PEZI|nr:hypothetical protein B0T18DRAFT_202804 [Schizothecium vesticola]
MPPLRLGEATRYHDGRFQCLPRFAVTSVPRWSTVEITQRKDPTGIAAHPYRAGEETRVRFPPAHWTLARNKTAAQLMMTDTVVIPPRLPLFLKPTAPTAPSAPPAPATSSHAPLGSEIAVSSGNASIILDAAGHGRLGGEVCVCVCVCLDAMCSHIDPPQSSPIRRGAGWDPPPRGGPSSSSQCGSGLGAGGAGWPARNTGGRRWAQAGTGGHCRFRGWPSCIASSTTRTAEMDGCPAPPKVWFPETEYHLLRLAPTASASRPDSPPPLPSSLYRHSIWPRA